ncbi:MAG: acetyltransferase [Thermodesulfovibrionales bacterium]|nr:acetyltransferase [Thermodesulfovibrionales bacterium]
MDEVIILGGGGHAKVLIDCILSTGEFRIKGILDPRREAGSSLLDIPVLGGDEFLEGPDAKGFALALGVGTVKASDVRKNIFEKHTGKGFQFPSFVHREAYAAKSSDIRNGAQVMAGAVIQAAAFIGEDVIVNTSAVIEHDCKIGAHCHISPGAVLGGNVEVGECSHIGLGARVLQGVKIGRNVTVAAGAVVISDVPDSKTVMGVPAR